MWAGNLGRNSGHTMKRTVVACSLLAALSTAAFAADLPTPPPNYVPAPPPPPPALFSGCYIDGGVGYGVSNIDHNGETIPGLVATSSSTTSGGRGWLGRAGGGCDYQFGLFSAWPAVIGVFGDYDFSSISGTVADPLSGLGGHLNQSGAWYGGARAGLLPTPNLLTYVDGGYTGAKFDQTGCRFRRCPPVPVALDLERTHVQRLVHWWRHRVRFHLAADARPVLAYGVSILHVSKRPTLPAFVTATGVPNGLWGSM